MILLYIIKNSIGNALGDGIDFKSDKFIAKFNPGNYQVDVSMPVIMDQIDEPTEKLHFNLTIPDEFSNVDGRLLVISEPSYTAIGEIMDGM